MPTDAQPCLDDSRVVVAQIKLWQYQDGTPGSFQPCIELKGHGACIQDMKVAGSDVLISADRGGTVATWGFGESNASQTPLQVFQTSHQNLMAVWVDDAILFTAGLDGHVKVRRRCSTVRAPAGLSLRHLRVCSAVAYATGMGWSRQDAA